MGDNETIIRLQQQLIESQQQIIGLQKDLIAEQKRNLALEREIKKLTPKQPKDKEVFWHLASDGVMSEEAANSDDPITVKQLDSWIRDFGRKHIKPYVNHKVYGECLNQMTRGLPRRLAELETKAEFKMPDQQRLASMMRSGR